MKSLITCSLGFMAAFSAACASAQGQGTEKPLVTASENRFDKEQISFVELLATPEKYEGKRIQVIGFFVSGYGSGLSLYLDKDHAMLADNTSRIALLVSDEQCQATIPVGTMTYANVEGTVCYEGAALCDVSLISAIDFEGDSPIRTRLCNVK